MQSLLKFCLALSLFFLSQTMSAQVWERITDLPQAQYTALEVIDGTLYTASGKNLYTSADGGLTWTHSQFTNQDLTWVTCFKKFGGRVYAATSKGIFSAQANAVHSVWNHDLQTVNITSFTEKDGVLYASMEVFGVMRFSGTGWTPFISGLPSYSMSVTEILNTPARLLAIAGANGTFYRYDFNQGSWIEDYYGNNGIIAGLNVDDIMAVGNTLYVSRYNTIYRSDDLGVNWIHDKLGFTSDGQARTMYVSGNTMYTISTIGTDTTRLNSRNVTATGTSWADNIVMLPFFTFALREVNGVFFIAAHNGVYTPEGALTAPEHTLSQIVVHPNPSAGHFTITGDTEIDAVKVFDVSGRLILSLQNEEGIATFTVTQKGIFLVELWSRGKRSVKKIVAE